MNVAIIGAGPLGRWLALTAAQAGHHVALEDVMPSTLHHAKEFLRQQLSAEVLERDARVSFVSTIEDAVRNADLAIDCVPDELESKLEVFCLLDRMAPPRTVLLTPTTQLSIADLAACTYRADRCIAIFAEPQSLVAQEVAPFSSTAPVSRSLLVRTTSKTAPGALSQALNFLEQLGFHPVAELDPAEGK